MRNAKKRINAANLQEQIQFNRKETVFFQYTQAPKMGQKEKKCMTRKTREKGEEKKEKCIL